MKNVNTGINQFRLIAAFMVVAIHCFPFQSFSKTLDILITLTLFRTAVPFFLMVTGFYLIGPIATKRGYPARLKVKKFLKKQVKLYVLVTLVYLPLAFYSGVITFKTSVIQFFQLIFFEGVLYHLWYFPALILCVLIVYCLLQRFTLRQVLLVTFLFYLLCLGGDSWWGLARQIPVLEKSYQGIFTLMIHTRNGLFFAPFFLTLGASFHQLEWNMRTSKAKYFLLIASLGMLVESYLLHSFSSPKHDSAYLFLPVVMFFLFPFILNWQPTRVIVDASTISLGIYILHPYVIAVVHTLAKKIAILNNSLLYYLCVSLLTSLIILYVHSKKKKTTKDDVTFVPRTRKVLSKQAVIHNLAQIKQVIPKTTKVMAVIKANAYGTDDTEFARILEQQGVDFFAVATIDEGIRLRTNGIEGQILILGYTPPTRIKELAHYTLIQTIVNKEHAYSLNQQKIPISCHLKIDTGMHRLGVEPVVQEVASLYQLPYLDIQGIYSHLGSADDRSDKGMKRTRKQISIFDYLLHELEHQKIDVGITHLQSSYGILNYPELVYDYVRPGILLYGYLSEQNGESKITLHLKPILEVQAMLVSKKWVAAGEYLGYGLDTKLVSPKLIGIVSIGYADGVPRELSNTEFCLAYQGQNLPQIGRICMDMLLVDLTDSPEIKVESQISIFPELEQTANQTNTLTNEIISRLGNRFYTEWS